MSIKMFLRVVTVGTISVMSCAAAAVTPANFFKCENSSGIPESIKIAISASGSKGLDEPTYVHITIKDENGEPQTEKFDEEFVTAETSPIGRMLTITTFEMRPAKIYTSTILMPNVYLVSKESDTGEKAAPTKFDSVLLMVKYNSEGKNAVTPPPPGPANYLEKNIPLSCTAYYRSR